jgi:hypothetical protein
MLEGLRAVPWADLQHAYGPAKDVPRLLRKLLDRSPKVRSAVMDKLYGNVFHQGTRFPAAPYVVPFLIEMCASSSVPRRDDLLGYWGSLITGYFSVQERPSWGDGERIYSCGEPLRADDPEELDPDFAAALHAIYRESLKGHELLCKLLGSGAVWVRAGAAWVLACLPTKASATLPKLVARAKVEQSGWVRAVMAFALGELGAAEPLHRMLARDPFPAARCMAACELARIDPSEKLLAPLLEFVSEPIEGYERLRGAGGKSSGDAAHSISKLPRKLQRMAVPAICDRLDQSRSFDIIPLVCTLLSAAFRQQTEPLVALTGLQRRILIRLVKNHEVWSIGNLMGTPERYGLPYDREKCARLAGVEVVDDEPLKALRSGLAFANIDFLDKAHDLILKALEMDPDVLERVPEPDQCLLLCAKAFAERDPEAALEAFRAACTANPGVAARVDPTWRLADLLAEKRPRRRPKAERSSRNRRRARRSTPSRKAKSTK